MLVRRAASGDAPFVRGLHILGSVLPIMLAAACTSGSTQPRPTPTASPKPVPLAFRTFFYRGGTPWPYSRDPRNPHNFPRPAVFSPTTFAYSTQGSSNCATQPVRLISHQPHALSFEAGQSQFRHGMCFDDLRVDQIVVQFNQPVLDSTHPVRVLLKNDVSHPLRLRLTPTPTSYLHLQFGSITGRSFRRWPNGRVRPFVTSVTLGGPLLQRTRTDAHGRFTFTDVPTGRSGVTNCVGCPVNPDCHGLAWVRVRPDATARARVVCRTLH